MANPFIQQYKADITKGYTDDMALIRAVQDVAYKGTMEDLKELVDTHSQDVKQDFFQTLEELEAHFNGELEHAI
ncbi:MULTISPECIES: hypothetical protein [unclassified Oceanobacillus]|uniref:hypothetical protein n=1 Tax=unclassified Oceanobacillus TaxID=2630292 RepID=UPI001BE6A857|nr:MULTISPECIES: hypothetical protein [unclassified Oceanobacillus]MBT2601255.1 hypothetical protein [Oceanobacillus sp. ISL-74]MBT2653639.1 hypothetical protein [Oceanobacillus sp. ISL-73]